MLYGYFRATVSAEVLFLNAKMQITVGVFFVYSPLVCTVIFLFETVDKSVHDPH